MQFINETLLDNPVLVIVLFFTLFLFKFAIDLIAIATSKDALVDFTEVSAEVHDARIVSGKPHLFIQYTYKNTYFGSTDISSFKVLNKIHKKPMTRKLSKGMILKGYFNPDIPEEITFLSSKDISLFMPIAKIVITLTLITALLLS